MTDPRDSLVLVVLYWAGIVGLALIAVYTLWYVFRWKPVKRTVCWSCGQLHPVAEMKHIPSSAYRHERLVCAECAQLFTLHASRFTK